MHLIQRCIQLGLFKALYTSPLADLLQLLHEEHLLTYPPLSGTCLQFSELEQRGVNETALASKRQQEDSNPGSLD